MSALAELHQKAKDAAYKSSQAIYEKMGFKDNYPCGFAWVQVFGVKLSTKEGREFARLGFRKSYNGGIELHNPGSLLVQNVDVKMAGAEAYAEVLRATGYKAYALDRLD